MLETLITFITDTPTDLITAICTAAVCAILITVVFTIWEFISDILIAILGKGGRKH